MSVLTRVCLWVVLAMTLNGCSNYEFRRNERGYLDVDELIVAVKQQPPGKSTLLESIWIPLIYSSVTRFHATPVLQLDPTIPSPGYALIHARSVGPLGFLWHSYDMNHYDPDGKYYHSRHGWGILDHFVAKHTRYVETEERGRYHSHEFELFFGLLQDRQDGFPRRMYADRPTVPDMDGMGVDSTGGEGLNGDVPVDGGAGEETAPTVAPVPESPSES